jgi:transposase-like protein
MVGKIGGRRTVLSRSVCDEGDVLGMLVPERRNAAAVLKPLRQLLRNKAVNPDTTFTDKLASYRAAARDLSLADRHGPCGMHGNNRTENSHPPI